MAYAPPKSILEVLQKIEFEEALEPNDARYVDTRAARGSQQTLGRLAKKFGLSLGDGAFYPATTRHVLFFGHTGSGKTTELRHYAQELSGPDRFFIVEVDITTELDRNNLQYADVLMAMARKLVERLQAEQVALSTAAIKDLEGWFQDHVLSETKSKELSAALETGVKAEPGIPLIASLFSKFTAAFKSNVTYKDELRRIVRNAFTQFATTFNRFLRSTEATLNAAGRGKRVLFIVDGADKLRGEDTRAFFVHDAEQLLAIECAVVYTAPLSLKYEGNLTNKLDADLVLPMIKLDDRDGKPFATGRDAMRQILVRRADRSIFETDAEINRLVDYSGGHPRELLRLLKLCCEVAESKIDAAAVSKAVELLASDYRRFLEPEDYGILATADHDNVHLGNDERTRKLMHNLALLEYNDGSWRRSHPVVRTLEGYTRALTATAPVSGD